MVGAAEESDRQAGCEVDGRKESIDILGLQTHETMAVHCDTPVDVSYCRRALLQMASNTQSVQAHRLNTENERAHRFNMACFRVYSNVMSPPCDRGKDRRMERRPASDLGRSPCSALVQIMSYLWILRGLLDFGGAVARRHC